MDLPFLWSYSAVGGAVAVLAWSALHPPRSRRKYLHHAWVAVIVLLSAFILLRHLEKPKWERHRAPCAVNLSQIQAAKAEWAREFRKSTAAVPREVDLFGPDKYILDRPSCPEGGTYRLRAVGELPTCNLVGWRHELDGKPPSHYVGNVAIQKAFFGLWGMALVILIRLVGKAWQVKDRRQKLCLGGLAALLLFNILVWLPNFLPARAAGSKSACSANLRSIQGAKETWAKDWKKSPTDIPQPSDLIGPGKYIPANPICPLHGTYRFGAVRERPTCSVGATNPYHTYEFNR